MNWDQVKRMFFLKNKTQKNVLKKMHKASYFICGVSWVESLHLPRNLIYHMNYKIDLFPVFLRLLD